MNSRRVSPFGTRVWLGYRHPSYLTRRQKFVNQLAEIFIPVTAQQMGPLGLSAYFPMVLPDISLSLPDEVALVIYPSPDVYKAAKSQTSSGRAYSALHGPYFNFSSGTDVPRSSSKFPSAWEGEIQFDTPYALCGNEVDWHAGACHVALIAINDETDSNRVLEDVNSLLRSTVFTPSSDSECIVQVNQTFILVWERTAGDDTKPAVVNELVSTIESDTIIRSQARISYVPQSITTPDPGVDVVEGDLLDVRLKK